MGVSSGILLDGGLGRLCDPTTEIDVRMAVRAVPEGVSPPDLTRMDGGLYGHGCRTALFSRFCNHVVRELFELGKVEQDRSSYSDSLT